MWVLGTQDLGRGLSHDLRWGLGSGEPCSLSWPHPAHLALPLHPPGLSGHIKPSLCQASGPAAGSPRGRLGEERRKLHMRPGNIWKHSREAPPPQP